MGEANSVFGHRFQIMLLNNSFWFWVAPRTHTVPSNLGQTASQIQPSQKEQQGGWLCGVEEEFHLWPRSACTTKCNQEDRENVGGCCQWMKSGNRCHHSILHALCITYIRVVIDGHHSILHAFCITYIRVVIDGHHSILHALASPTLEW